MSVTDEILEANRRYAETFKLGDLPMPPARKLAVVACMDARLTVEDALGLKTGDAHIIRNAGGLATEDALRSLILSHYLLGTQEFLVINHTECGLLNFEEDKFRQRLWRETGAHADSPAHFFPFRDLEENVREQILKVRSHAWIPAHIPVRGFVFDVKTGSLHEVEGSARPGGPT